MKRKAILRTVGLICPACGGKPMPHDDCEKGICLCFRTAHQAIGVKAVAGNQEQQSKILLWCQKCDRSFQTKPIAGVCEFCGGKLTVERNLILRKQWGRTR